MASAGVAGPSPAAIEASIAVWKQQERRHDVSIQAGAVAGAAYRGIEPRAKTSMTIMRPPQHGHGRGSTPPSGSAFSVAPAPSASAAGKTASSARALAIFSARPPLARSP